MEYPGNQLIRVIWGQGYHWSPVILARHHRAEPSPLITTPVQQLRTICILWTTSVIIPHWMIRYMHHANQIVNKPPLFAAALLPVIEPALQTSSILMGMRTRIWRNFSWRLGTFKKIRCLSEQFRPCSLKLCLTATEILRPIPVHVLT